MPPTAAGKFTLAMGQMLVEEGNPDANLARAGRLIADAGRQGCDAIVLPECMARC